MNSFQSMRQCVGKAYTLVHNVQNYMQLWTWWCRPVRILLKYMEQTAERAPLNPN